MRKLLRCLTFALVGAAVVPACKDTDKIPGTEIPDTDENRDILRVLERYRTAFVRRDPAGVLATAHPTYFDEGGTDDPSDDIEYEALGPILRERMAQIDSVRFTIDYLEISVNQDRAVVKVWIDASFRLKALVDAESGDTRVVGRHNRKQDHAMFELLHDAGAWRITRGL
jgi:hypothetical protein